MDEMFQREVALKVIHPICRTNRDTANDSSKSATNGELATSGNCTGLRSGSGVRWPAVFFRCAEWKVKRWMRRYCDVRHPVKTYRSFCACSSRLSDRCVLSRPRCDSLRSEAVNIMLGKYGEVLVRISARSECILYRTGTGLWRTIGARNRSCPNVHRSNCVTDCVGYAQYNVAGAGTGSNRQNSVSGPTCSGWG